MNYRLESTFDELQIRWIFDELQNSMNRVDELQIRVNFYRLEIRVFAD